MQWESDGRIVEKFGGPIMQWSIKDPLALFDWENHDYRKGPVKVGVELSVGIPDWMITAYGKNQIINKAIVIYESQKAARVMIKGIQKKSAEAKE
jgi:hypothetical protein